MQRYDIHMLHYPTQIGYQPLGPRPSVGHHIGQQKLLLSSGSLDQAASPPLPPPPAALPLPQSSASTFLFEGLNNSSSEHCTSAVGSSSLALPPPPPPSILASVSQLNSTQAMDCDDSNSNSNSNSSTLASSFSYKDPASMLLSGASDPAAAVQHLFNRKSLHHHPISILQSSASTTNLNMTPMSGGELSLLSVTGTTQRIGVPPLNSSLLSGHSSGGDSSNNINNSSSSTASSSSVSASSSSGSGGGAAAVNPLGSLSDPARLQFFEQLMYFKKIEKPHESTSATLLHSSLQQPPSN